VSGGEDDGVWDERAAAEVRVVHPDSDLVLELALDGIFATDDATAVSLWIIANDIMIFFSWFWHFFVLPFRETKSTIEKYLVRLIAALLDCKNYTFCIFGMKGQRIFSLEGEKGYTG
jgi:hypothetical protein